MAMAQASPHLLWLSARGAQQYKARLGRVIEDGKVLRVQVKPAAVFTHALRGALMGTSLGNELLAAGLSMDMSTADDWATSDVWAQYDSKVIALALVRPQGIHTFMHAQINGDRC